MEADCKDNSQDTKMSSAMASIAQMISNLSNQMTLQNQSIEERIIKNETRLSDDFQRIANDNELFKNDVRAELDGLRTLLDQYNITSNPAQVPSSTTQSILTSCSPVRNIQTEMTPVVTAVSPTAPTNSTLDTTTDPQTRMMLMLTETFAKLSSTLSDKKEETKSDWPKFSGDQRKFRPWYMAIMSQLSLPPWQELYDPITNEPVQATANTQLNAKLYAKLLVSLEGSAFQSIVSREHLRANGLLLLQDLVQTYRPKPVPEVLASKTSAFWGSTKRLPTETLDEYYNRFRELLYDISNGPDQISSASAMRHFIFTLGSEFKPIQNNYRMDNLPDKWKNADWPTLLILCRDFFHSVKPQGVSKLSTPTDGFVDHSAHRKKVRNWFMDPIKFCKEIEAEQRKHPNKCIYHLSKTHPTDTCNIKKECDKLRGANQLADASIVPTTSTRGQLRHILEEEVPQVEDDIQDVVSEEEPDNDTNDAILNYFSLVTKHYLRLVKTTPDLAPRHDTQFPIIADSGANFHMFREKKFFESIQPATGHVVLGDGQTKVPILGIGTVKMRIANNILTIPEVRYIPGLSESIYSLFVHIRTPLHGLNSSFEHGLDIIFPAFSIKARLGQDDIYLDGLPVSVPVVSSSSISDNLYCSHVTHPSGLPPLPSKKENNILFNLRQYYDEVKTKRQLNIEVPVGFRKENNFQRQVHAFHLGNTPLQDLSSLSDAPDGPSVSVSTNSVYRFIFD
jgi:hypothetical protein